MHLFISILVGTANLCVALVGGYGTIAPLLRNPGIETLTAFLVTVAPFLAVAAFAFGKRSRKIWMTAFCLNLLSLIGMMAILVLAYRADASSNGLASGIGLAGLFTAVNLGYLLWRMPTTASSESEVAR